MSEADNLLLEQRETRFRLSDPKSKRYTAHAVPKQAGLPKKF